MTLDKIKKHRYGKANITGKQILISPSLAVETPPLSSIFAAERDEAPYANVE